FTQPVFEAVYFTCHQFPLVFTFVTIAPFLSVLTFEYFTPGPIRTFNESVVLYVVVAACGVRGLEIMTVDMTSSAAIINRMIFDNFLFMIVLPFFYRIKFSHQKANIYQKCYNFDMNEILCNISEKVDISLISYYDM